MSVALALSGCSSVSQMLTRDDWKSWTPDSTALQIATDSTVTETIFDTLDQSYYQADDLQDMIARSVREYNEENGAGSISVTAYSVAGGQVTAALVYDSPDDYAAYNNLPLFDGSMLDAEMAGYLFAGPFRKVSGDASISASDVSTEEAMSHKEYHVVVCDRGHTVQVPGQIRYLSSNALPVNSHTASPAPEDQEKVSDETEAGLILPSSAVYRRVQETESGPQSGEEGEDALIYVIYEPDSEPVLSPYAQMLSGAAAGKNSDASEGGT